MLDPGSVEAFKDDSMCTEFKATQEHLWKNTVKLEDCLGKAATFAAILYIGGYGRKFQHRQPILYILTNLKHRLTNPYPSAMFDLVDDPVSIKLIREFHDASKMISAVCHGPAALLKVSLADGTLLIKGHRITGFSDQEEVAVEKQNDTPFGLEKALNTASAGFYEKAPDPMGPKVIVTANGKLLTGQNPPSAYPLAVEILNVLQGVGKIL